MSEMEKHPGRHESSRARKPLSHLETVVAHGSPEKAIEKKREAAAAAARVREKIHGMKEAHGDAGYGSGEKGKGHDAYGDSHGHGPSFGPWYTWLYRLPLLGVSMLWSKATGLLDSILKKVEDWGTKFAGAKAESRGGGGHGGGHEAKKEGGGHGGGGHH